MKQPVNENGIEGIDFIKCKICGEKFNQLNHRHLTTRHNITSKEYKEKYNVTRLTAKIFSKKREKTFIKKYGAKNQFGRKDVVIDRELQITNTKKVMMEKYGVENISQLNSIKQKKKDTCNRKYGMDCNLAYQNKQKMIEKYSKKLDTNNLDVINEYRMVERKLHNNFSGTINKVLKKDNIKLIDLLPYSKDELINHLKSTMPNGYTWDDYLNCTLEVDHIIPKSAYKIKSNKGKEFIKCWSLKNLRLLHHKKNASKRDKLDWKLIDSCNIRYLLPNYLS